MVNNIDIIGIGDRRKYDISTNRELLSLDEYYSIANRIIRKNYSSISKSLLSNEDALAQIVYSIILADIHYDEEHGTIYSYRKIRAIWAIKNYLLRRQKSKLHNVESIDNKTNTSKFNEQYSSDIEDYRKNPLQVLLDNEDSQKVKEKIYNIVWDSTLSDKAKNCIWKYYIESENVQDIADSYGITKQAVYNLIKVSVVKLKPLIHQDKFLRNVAYEC